MPRPDEVEVSRALLAVPLDAQWDVHQALEEDLLGEAAQLDTKKREDFLEETQEAREGVLLEKSNLSLLELIIVTVENSSQASSPASHPTRVEAKCFAVGTTNQEPCSTPGIMVADHGGLGAGEWGL